MIGRSPAAAARRTSLRPPGQIIMIVPPLIMRVMLPARSEPFPDGSCKPGAPRR